MNDEELEQDIRDNLINDLEEDLMELVAALQNIATKTTCAIDRYYLMESAVTMEHLFAEKQMLRATFLGHISAQAEAS